MVQLESRATFVFSATITLLIAALCLPSCALYEEPEALDQALAVNDLEINPDPVRLELGQTTQANATLYDRAGTEIEGLEVSWSSSNDSIATIDADGVVEGLSTGNTTITARVGQEQASATVVIDTPITRVQVEPAEAEVHIGDRLQLSAVAYGEGDTEDEGEIEFPAREAEWSSADEDVATVDVDGRVTGVTAGEATIRATFSGVTGTATVTVFEPVDRIDISPAQTEIEVTDTLELMATAKDSDGNVVGTPDILWTSSDPQVVTVDAEGLIVGLEGGSATITAQAANIIGTADITVEDPVRSVVVSPSPASVEVTDTVQLSAELADKAGNPLSGRAVDWSSSDTDVATVDANGVVTAVAGGEVTITAESEGEAGTADITVEAPVRTIEVSPDPAGVEVGQSVSLTATPRDLAGDALSGYSVSWTSDDPDVATVDSSGLVSGVAEGSATVSASVDDGTGTTVTGSAAVNVGATVATVIVSPGETSLFSGEQAQLEARVEDTNANELTGRTVTWTSQDTDVATVDSTGLVTAVDVGSTTITADSESVADTATIDVVEWVQTDVGRHYSCGVLSNGQGYCWGTNTASGAIGDGTSDSSTDENTLNHDADKTSPALVSGNHTFASIRPGYFHTCGLTTTGAAYCWGYGGAGSLGQGSGSSSAVPVSVSGAHTFAEIGVGANHTCARNAADEVFCWGANTLGQVGVGSTTNAFAAPQKVLGHSFVDLAVGANHSCGIDTSGDTYCWGSNSAGQVGDGTNNDANTPTLVSTSQIFVDVEVGSGHSCGINASGEVYCWGANSYSQLGDGTTTDQNTPVRAVPGNTYTELRVGGPVSCGINASREAYCWGFNGQGNLGTGSFNASETAPVRVSGAYSWDMLRPGFEHTCGLAAASPDSLCWGDNEYGQVGDGTNGNDQAIPTQVLRP